MNNQPRVIVLPPSWPAVVLGLTWSLLKGAVRLSWWLLKVSLMLVTGYLGIMFLSLWIFGRRK